MELEEREVTVRVYSNIAMGKDDLIYGVSGDIFYSIIKISRASRWKYLDTNYFYVFIFKYCSNIERDPH